MHRGRLRVRVACLVKSLETITIPEQGLYATLIDTPYLSGSHAEGAMFVTATCKEHLRERG